MKVQYCFVYLFLSQSRRKVFEWEVSLRVFLFSFVFFEDLVALDLKLLV